MTENQPTAFYGVAYGYNRGVFSTYKEALAAMKGFPQAVYKKFKTREEAEEFVQKSRPEKTIFEATETDTDDKFYAVARGRIIGIFKDHETVKKNTHGFPKSMHKKFNNFAEAKRYFDKFSEGKVEETIKSPRKKRAHAETTEDGNVEKFPSKTVARKRTSDKIGDTDDSEGGELDHTQVLNESTEDEEEGGGEGIEDQDNKQEEKEEIKKMEETEKIENGGEIETNKIEDGEKIHAVNMMEEGKDHKEEDKSTNIANDDEPQQKQSKMEEE